MIGLARDSNKPFHSKFFSMSDFVNNEKVLVESFIDTSDDFKLQVALFM